MGASTAAGMSTSGKPLRTAAAADRDWAVTASGETPRIRVPVPRPSPAGTTDATTVASTSPPIPDVTLNTLDVVPSTATGSSIATNSTDSWSASTTSPTNSRSVAFGKEPSSPMLNACHKNGLICADRSAPWKTCPRGGCALGRYGRRHRRPTSRCLLTCLCSHHIRRRVNPRLRLIRHRSPHHAFIRRRGIRRIPCTLRSRGLSPGLARHQLQSTFLWLQSYCSHGRPHPRACPSHTLVPLRRLPRPLTHHRCFHTASLAPFAEGPSFLFVNLSIL